MKAIIAYVPVPHLGYLSLFRRHQPADILLLTIEAILPLDEDVGTRLGRDFKLRALPYEMVKKTFEGEFETSIIIVRDLSILESYSSFVMPDERVSELVRSRFPEKDVVIDDWFVRWDWNNTTIPKEVTADYTITIDDFHRDIMKLAFSAAARSSDFWRQIGAVVIFDKPYVAFNEHFPTSMEPYINGDMRLIMKPGESPDICGALHAERAIIAYAASNENLSLEGRDLYVTTFPCLPCAQQIAATGIKRVFFSEGYSNQHAQEVLQAEGIEIIQVK